MFLVLAEAVVVIVMKTVIVAAAVVTVVANNEEGAAKIASRIALDTRHHHSEQLTDGIARSAREEFHACKMVSATIT